MQIKSLSQDTEDFTGNIWLIQGSENVLIDAGTGDSWKNLLELDSVDKVVITHSHYDHVDNLPKVQDKFEPEIYSYEPENLPVDSKKVNDGDTIKLSEVDFKVIHTPGHRDDSICLYSPEEKLLFAGDLIFPQGSFGRTDLEEGDRDLLINSIEKITELDVDKMYCGHDPAAVEKVNQQIKKSLQEAKKKQPKY